jgi:hypothetical protein
MSNLWGCSLALLLAANVGVPRASVVECGEWHGHEVTARTGERWMGLVLDGDRFRWRPYLLTVAVVHDPVVDGPGKAVRVRGVKPVFLVRGIDAITKIEQVETAFYADARRFEDGQPLAVRLGEGTYSLRLIDPQLADTASRRPSQFEISDGIRKQILRTWPDGFSDQMCSLRWAGDLDGDGKLDLYMWLSDHYNVTEHTLLLSSLAKKDELVGVAAVWTTTGC